MTTHTKITIKFNFKLDDGEWQDYEKDFELPPEEACELAVNEVFDIHAGKITDVYVEGVSAEDAVEGPANTVFEAYTRGEYVGIK